MEPADAPFFRDWDARLPGQRRSLDRARALLAATGVAAHLPPVLTVVGSKGKGTTAVYASAYLAAAGRRVVTVTSPSLRHSGERIRVDGTAIDEATLAGLAQRLDAYRGGLPEPRPGDGYLSPSGLFTIAGLLHTRDLAADYLVLEAGRGGSSDEVSLVAPAAVAITPIFAEHLAALGGSVAAVVADKCGVVRDSTRAVLTVRQPEPVAELIDQEVAARTGGRLAAELPVAEVPDHLLPPGLGRDNARLGCAAARRLLPSPPEPARLAQVLATVRLPGRLSRHRLPGTRTDLLVDAAVSQAGFAAAVEYATARLGGIDHVLLSLPDDKDLAGAAEELRGLPVTFVTLAASHLRYTHQLPAGWTRVPADRVDRSFVAGLGDRLLGLGTVSFVGHLLTIADAPTTAWWAERGSYVRENPTYPGT